MNAPALIKQARHWAGRTQAHLPKAAKTSQPTLAAYETGAKAWSVRTLDRLSRGRPRHRPT